MADRRRRRALEDEGEEKENAPKERPSECESEGDLGEAGDLASEYESAAEENRDPGADEDSEEGSEEETDDETEEGSEEEDDDDDEEEYTDDDVIIEGEEQIEEERQSGDGEEQPDKENVDDDEDKKNPAYVPRKGAFYEHDMRTGQEDEEPEEELKPKKKLWQDEGKWGHDRFREDMQAPKSREELMAMYGYDIRASDKPPEAPPARLRGRGRGRPQRSSKLSDFMESPRNPRPQPEPEPEPVSEPECEPEPTRMAVIDTTDYNHKPKPRPPPPSTHSQEFEDFDEDIDVPYMTTIDTTQSSADSYQPRSQRRRGGGPRQRRDRQSFEDNQTHNSYQNYENNQEHRSNRNRHSYMDRNGGRQGYRSQDARFSQNQDARFSPRQDSYSQDYPSLNRRPTYENTQGSRGPRLQEDFRNKNNRNMPDEEGEYGQRNSFSRPQRDGSRGGYSKMARGRERNDRNNRPPRYSRMEREERSHNPSQELVPAAREFTNSSFRNAPPNDRSELAENNTQLDKMSGEKRDDHQSSQDVVISNKENVQTISVTITNTTTERKSYAKERRGKSEAAAIGPPGGLMGAGDSALMPPVVEASPSHGGGRGNPASFDKHPSEKRYQRGGAGPRLDGEQNRPKRYSSQRQRNMLEYGYGDAQHQGPPAPSQQQQHPQQKQQKQLQQQQQQQPHQQQSPPKKPVPVDSSSPFYKQVYPPGHPPAPMFHPELAGAARPPPPPQDPAAFNTAMLQPPMSFHLPVSGPGMPSPPRLMGPNMAAAPPGTVAVPISNASPQLLAAPYLAAPGVIYSAPPPPTGPTPPFQVPLAYTSPPPTAPPPTLTQQQVASPQSQPEVHRGGTVYFPPYLQQPSSRSPARRQKVAIPIVDPTELKKKNSVEGSPTTAPEDPSQMSREKTTEVEVVSVPPTMQQHDPVSDANTRNETKQSEPNASHLVAKTIHTDTNKSSVADTSFPVKGVQDILPDKLASPSGVPASTLLSNTSENKESSSTVSKLAVGNPVPEREVAESPPISTGDSSTRKLDTVQAS